MIRSAGAWVIACGCATLCVAMGLRPDLHGSEIRSDQKSERCRADCAVGKETVATLSGVDIPSIGSMLVQDSRGRYVVLTSDFRELLTFDSTGKLLASPRPKHERIVSLFVGPSGAVQAYDSGAGALFTFDGNYRVTGKTELPHSPALPLAGGKFLVASQIGTPDLVGVPLHVMSKDGSIVKSFGADGSPFHSAETLKNSRSVCLNPDGSIWSIASGGRILEHWEPSTGRRLGQVAVKSTWFRESTTPAKETQVAKPIVLTIWADADLVWILYRAPDPNWTPRAISEKEHATAQIANRRSDWVLEAVRTDTGGVVAMKRFDRMLRRWDGSFAIASEATSPGRVELWKPIVVKK